MFERLIYKKELINIINNYKKLLQTQIERNNNLDKEVLYFERKWMRLLTEKTDLLKYLDDNNYENIIDIIKEIEHDTNNDNR